MARETAGALVGAQGGSTGLKQNSRPQGIGLSWLAGG